MSSKMQKLSTTFLAMIGCAIMPVTASAHHHHHRRGDRDAGRDLLRAFLATAAYNSTAQAAADGYGPFPDGVPLHECITAPNPADGAMGFHWLNGANVDTTLDAAHPEVLVYEPQADGSLRLVALEYVVFADAWQAEHGDEVPQLFGRDLTFMDAPNRFELPPFYQIHAWIWKDNPAGQYASFNPDVSCQFASE